MSRFKMSNKVFELGLDAQEMAVYLYLCSIPSERPMITGNTVKVKQSTIAHKCSIKAVQTVSRIISRLKEKGLAEPYARTVKDNRQKGTYIYTVKKLSAENSFFFVDRHIFGKLNPRQMMIYLFISKSYNQNLGYCWNSYNDISAQTGMKRETVIRTINELVEMHFITKYRCKSKENRKVYVDNHYQIVFFIRLKIKKSIKKVRLFLQHKNSHTKSTKHTFNKYNYNDSIKTLNCQEVCFKNRGSP